MTPSNLSLSGSGLIRGVLCIRETWFGEHTRRVLLAGSTFFRQTERGIALALILLVPVSHLILKAQTSQAPESRVGGATKVTGSSPAGGFSPHICFNTFMTSKAVLASGNLAAKNIPTLNSCLENSLVEILRPRAKLSTCCFISTEHGTIILGI